MPRSRDNPVDEFARALKEFLDTLRAGAGTDRVFANLENAAQRFRAFVNLRYHQLGKG